MKHLINEIAACQVCTPYLEHGPRPIIQAHPNSKVVIIGQAPGLAVHQSGVPWKDKSGDTLREWLGIDSATFYDPVKVALLPMGFCYPGKGTSGDLPPRAECAPLWHQRVLELMTEVRLTLLIGSYAQTYYLGIQKKRTLTETVKAFEEYLPEHLVLPHPSPRNNIWQAKNPWFKKKVVPALHSTLDGVFVSK